MDYCANTPSAPDGHPPGHTVDKGLETLVERLRLALPTYRSCCFSAIPFRLCL